MMKSDGNGGYIVDKRHIYVTLPVLIAVVIMISSLVTQAVTATETIKKLEADVIELEAEFDLHEQRMDILEQHYNIINTKLDSVIKTQDKVVTKIDQLHFNDG